MEFFDLAYIDAAHDYESVAADIKGVLPHVRNDGWIAGHDYAADVRRAVGELLTAPRTFGDTSWLTPKNAEPT